MIHLLYKHTKALSDVIITTDGNVTQEREMLHCCHCDRRWRVEPGSGKKRGFCHNCNQVTCGFKECDICVPLEKKLGW